MRERYAVEERCRGEERNDVDERCGIEERNGARGEECGERGVVRW